MLSDLADMSQEERDRVYDEIIRVSARPNQKLGVRYSSPDLEECIFEAFQRLRGGHGGLTIKDAGVPQIGQPLSGQVPAQDRK